MKKINIMCEGSESFHVDEFVDLQGLLKSRTSDSYEKLKNSIVKYGFRFPIFYVFLENKKFILDGHGRLMAIKRMISEGFVFGENNKLPAVKIDAKSKKEAKEILLALNSKYGEMSTDSLHDFLSSDGIQVSDIEDFFVPMDFAMEEFVDTVLQYNLENEDFNGTKDVEIPEPVQKEEKQKKERESGMVSMSQNPVIKTGDVVILGKHRLICSRPDDSAGIAILLNGEKIKMMFTALPMQHNLEVSTILYGLESLIDNDCSIYIMGDHHDAPIVWDWMRIWSDFFDYCTYSRMSPTPNLTGNNWTFDSNLVCYANRGNYKFIQQDGELATSTWRLGNTQMDDNRNAGVPVNVSANAILHSTDKGDIVVDVIGKAGSTMMACLKHDRICYMAEEDQKYCQYIIDRHVEETNNAKININGKDVDWYNYKSEQEK